MKQLADRDPMRVGIAAVAAAAALTVLITVLSMVSFGAKTYTAHLAQTAGLRAGEDVQVAGVNVGTVRSVELNGRDVLVTFTLDPDIELGAETTASVEVATLLGTHLLAVDPEGTGGLLDDSIPLAQTDVPYNLQDVIDKGATAIEGLDAKLLARALTAVANTTDAASEEFGPALRGVSRISRVVADRSSQTGALLEAAQGVSGRLSASSDDLLTLMKQTKLVLDEIYSRRAAIHTLLNETVRLGQALTSVVTTTRGDLEKALKDVQAVLKMLREEDKTLKRALTLMGPSARYLANATGSGPWIDVMANNILPDGLICQAKGTC